MSRDPRPENAVSLRLELAPDDRDRLYDAAARVRKSMASYLRDVVLRHLDEMDARDRKKRDKGG